MTGPMGRGNGTLARVAYPGGLGQSRCSSRVGALVPRATEALRETRRPALMFFACRTGSDVRKARSDDACTQWFLPIYILRIHTFTVEGCGSRGSWSGRGRIDQGCDDWVQAFQIRSTLPTPLNLAVAIRQPCCVKRPQQPPKRCGFWFVCCLVFLLPIFGALWPH